MKISSFDKLYEVMSGLHDCPFDLNKVQLDDKTRTWTGLFYRPLLESPDAERSGNFLLGSTRLPVARALLTCSDVVAARVDDRANIGWYTFNTIHQTENGVRLYFSEAMEIDLELSPGINAAYDESDLPGVTATYTNFLVVESGPRLEGLAGT